MQIRRVELTALGLCSLMAALVVISYWVRYWAMFTPAALPWLLYPYGIMIYAVPPEGSPKGFHVRQVHDRVYVVANWDFGPAH